MPAKHRRSPSYYSSSSTSSPFSLLPRLDRHINHQALASPPTRPFHIKRRRRASQPLPASTSLKYAASATARRHLGDLSSSAGYSSTSADSSSEDDDDAGWKALNGAAHRGTTSLEYLDLSLSLPYTLVSVRNHFLSYLADLESRVRGFYNSHQQGFVDPFFGSKPESSRDSQFAPFYAQLEALRDDLRKLALLLPSPSSSFPFPSPPSIPNPGAVLAARSQSLASDWERLSSSFKFPLQLRSGFPVALPRPKMPSAPDPRKFRSELPSLPTLPSFQGFPQLEMDFAALWQPLSSHLPTAGLNILAKIQTRLEALQESASAITLRDCFYSSHGHALGGGAVVGHDDDDPDGHDDDDKYRRLARRIHPSLSERFEKTLGDLTARGKARAGSVVQRAGEAARGAEDAFHQMALELARNGQALLRYENLPDLWKNNEHILSGYRFIPARNWWGLVRSTFQIHNETGNIHTHLWGLVVILPLFWPSKGLDEQTTPTDRFIQTLYLIAAAKCLTLSVSWHVMAGCSDHKWFERFACVDYTGIAWLVAASILTTVYNAFYCQPNLAMFYSATTLLVGLVGAILPWAAWFNDRSAKPIRIAVFLTMCFTALLPFSHAAFEHGLVKTATFFSPILPSLAFYVGGLVLYALQIPESLAPGKFDLWGHSHQLWHIGIVLAILSHHSASLTFHAGRFDFSCSAATSPLGGTVTNHGNIDLLFEKAGGLEGIVGLSKADKVIHHWRQILGSIGGGALDQELGAHLGRDGAEGSVDLDQEVVRLRELVVPDLELDPIQR
ncbi:HlyIII-domain-containing protein [Violaceomyces palustris]|uniref:HlyIII-domain-containing protein n=1 Tax=Violaceomyces palustris TaxID=1673888 RepID=A0ACD0P4N5_9BASI|nr:HlyIII-domain-containing protein [Violaceomyces palustris]